MEGDAGADQLTPIEADGLADQPDEPLARRADQPDEPLARTADEEVVTDALPDAAPASVATGSHYPASRLGRGWVIGIAATLLLLAAAAATGGFFALRAHNQGVAQARADDAAIAAAKDCIAATQAPDTAAMSDSQRKILECSTGDFAAQATLYSGVLVEAYQAADVKVQVSDMRAAVEGHNDDGSVTVLVAMRVKVSNSNAQGQEQGYRLRVQMAPDEGQYKIADLAQVSS